MRKLAFFDTLWAADWPSVEYLEPYFRDTTRRAKFFADGHDGGSFSAEGMYGTGDLVPRDRQINSRLFFVANPEHGIMLGYSKWDGRTRHKDDRSSRGDPSRLRQFMISVHGTSLSLGLFIPFEAGWHAVKEFIQTEGELPASIAWVANDDLLPGTFPLP